MHVFADLQPYICTSPSCSDELIQFSTRSAWAQHEFEEHQTEYVWKCNECGIESTSPELWRNHLQKAHDCVLSRSQLLTAVGTALRCRDKPVDQEVCPLCLTHPGTSRRKFATHVGRHMEEIALVVLPREIEEDSDSSTASGGEDDNRLSPEASPIMFPSGSAGTEISPRRRAASPKSETNLRHVFKVGSEVIYKVAKAQDGLQEGDLIQCIIIDISTAAGEER